MSLIDLSGVISLGDEVEGHEHNEADGREQQGRQQRALLPLSSLERLVLDGARVARHEPHEHVQQEHRHRQTAAVGGVHEPDRRLRSGW